MTARKANIERATAETTIKLALALDGTGEAKIDTGIGFLNHLLTTLTRHAKLDLELSCRGDLYVDDHHSAEDTALSLGAALDAALGDRRGITRFGSAYAPLDEALARAVVDLSGRPHAAVDLNLNPGRIGELRTENITHVIQSLAVASRATLHVDVLKGDNDHHRAEAAFKALALALKTAIRSDGSDKIPSTKEVL